MLKEGGPRMAGKQQRKREVDSESKKESAEKSFQVK
jgi:hypothetical protein